MAVDTFDQLLQPYRLKKIVVGTAQTLKGMIWLPLTLDHEDHIVGVEVSRGMEVRVAMQLKVSSACIQRQRQAHTQASSSAQAWFRNWLLIRIVLSHCCRQLDFSLANWLVISSGSVESGEKP
jgi:hypothetical protein